MKKMKGLLLISICAIGFGAKNVFAESEPNARVGTTTSRVDAQTCAFKYSNGQCHKDYDITIRYEGVEYAGYCGNLGKVLPNYYDPDTGRYDVNNYSCTVEENTQISSVLNADGYSQAQKTGALRNITEGLTTDDQGVQNLLNSAGGSGTLSLTKIGETTSSVTYSINTTIDMSKVTFTCGSGCSSVSANGNVLTVILQPEACSFTFSATYPGNTSNTTNSTTSGSTSTTTTTNKILKCVNDAGQVVYGAYSDSSTTTIPNQGGNPGGTPGMVTQNFSGSLDRCNEEPNKCTQQTTFDIPSYCDDAEGEEIKITAPDDIKYCILNGKDEAGNTYQMMNDGLRNNPYCAVYCKEDYTMKMPGAQYANSGRYFELQDTIVKAKRTCYATNPNGDSDKPEILIEDFVSDVIEKQLAVLEAYNAYKKAEEELRLYNNNAWSKATTTGCKPEDTADSFTLNTSFYEGYKVDSGLCNSQTGVCRLSPTTDSTTQWKWGGEYTKDKCGSCTGGESPTGGTCPVTSCKCESNYSSTGEHNFAEEAQKALNNLNAAVNSLKQTIEWMEGCYNWVNELCLDTKTFFKYDEQYSGSINYEKVGETIENDKEIGFRKDKNLDNAYTTSNGSMESLENRNYIYCDAGSCSSSNEATLAEKISTLQSEYYYIKKVSEGEATYRNTQQFQTNYPHGTIETVTDPSAVKHNYSYLGAKFPVALNTPHGVYNWTLDFSNLGQYNGETECRNGRLDDVARALGKSTGAAVEYVCVYVVDCPDCDYECIDPSGNNCVIPDPDPKCDDCDVYCIDCIFDGDGNTFFYRQVGSEINPSKRKLGANLTSEKGKETIKQIETDGENIYIEAEYKFTMTPEQMKNIRDYNKTTGNYVRDDLKYGSFGGYDNIEGKSEFLRGTEAQKSKYFDFKTAKFNNNWTLWSNVGNNMGPAWK